MAISYRPQIGGLDAVSLVTINATANGLSVDSAQVLTLVLSSTSTTGALSSTDWNTFNGKQAAGNYITALTGDATASGPGSVALTLATVNSNVGSFGTATQTSTFTVNAKGLITAASNTAIQIAESQVTSLVSDLALKAPLASPTFTGTPAAPTASQGNNSTLLATTAYVDTGLATKQATGSYITALTGDVTASGPGSVASTLATVNSNVGSFTNASITVNAKGLITAAANGTGGSGTVTSVAASVPSVLSISGSPITTSGTLAISYSGTALPIANGGTNSIAALNNNRVMQSSGGAVIEAAAITASRALVSDSNGIPTHATTTSTEIGYVNGVTSAIQTQINTKAPTASPTFTGVATTPVLTLTPQTSDPGSPTTGEIQYADGTARTAGPWYYSGSSWQPVGANAGFIGTDLIDAGGLTITSTGGSTAVIGTTSRNKVQYRREGQFAYIYYELITTGAGTAGAAGDYLIALPSGLVADTSLITLNTSGSGGSSSTAARQVQGVFNGCNITGGNGQSEWAASMYDSTHFRLVGLIGGAGGVWYTSSTYTLGTTAFTIGGWIKIPISGWATNTVAAVQSINARAHNSATSISGSLATIVWTTEDYDTDNALVSGVFTVPSSGKYHIDTALAIAGTFVLNSTSVMEVQVNGTVKAAKTQYIGGAITNESISLSTDLQLTANDTVRVQYSNSGTSPTIVNSDTKNYFNISKIGN